MKSFLRENPTIAFGLGLPVLLVTVFLLISGIPTVLVAPPQYEVLYATQYDDYQSGVQISVVKQKVQVIYQGGEAKRPKPRLWRYNPKTGAVKELTIVLPPGLSLAGKTQSTPTDASKTTPIYVLDLEGVDIDSSSIAPDGYEFSLGEGRYSGDIFSGLFYSSRNRHEAVLKKKGRRVRLPNSVGHYYLRNIHFIGWIVPS